MMWEITNSGFLGTQDPVKSLFVSDEIYNQVSKILEKISSCLADWIEERRVREELVYYLREIYDLLDDNFYDLLDNANRERLMLIYSYIASAYVYARHELPASRLPREIAVPLVKIADILGRKPILSYASYCLTNWERIESFKPIELGNIKLLTNFCAPECGKQDEDWFILVHVEIEANAASAVTACKRLLKELSLKNPIEIDLAKSMLSQINSSLEEMNKTLERMPEQCSPDNYFRWVRPYIFYFKDIVYEGCFNNQPQSFRGETGAQSTIIPMLLAALEIKHKDSMLTQHLLEMREYMPKPHRDFVVDLENIGPGLRELAKTHDELKPLYNDCINQIVRFRSKHFEYAVNYIYNKVESPDGTGGTPYVPWLKQLKEETEEHIL